MASIELVMLGKTLFYIFITPLIVYSLKFYGLAFASMFHRGRREEKPRRMIYPRVTVQIPVYNDPVVVECVRSCLRFDYPGDKYDIIVIDDSSDGRTSRMLDKLKAEGKDFRIIRRKSRRGFKAGALNDATRVSTGDIIVIFDSDYVLGADFLRKIVQPFRDRGIAFVQTRWDYINPRKSIVSRIAMMSYNAFHQCSMPVKERIGTSIFCGTGGAIRKSVLLEAGGWNEENIGEDIDLTVRILDRGHRQAYLPYVKARGEVPETLKSFVKQQERWAYGTTKVMREYLARIFRSSGLSRKQKLDLFFIVTGFFVFPFILGVSASTIMTMHAWFGPEGFYTIFNMEGFLDAAGQAAESMLSYEGITIIILSTGYIFECGVALIQQRRYMDIPFLPFIFLIGFIIQFTNTIAVFKALFGMKHSFYKTPKMYYKAVA
jgi:cellulose synthase/poly-beta-1,6-N-acetylglucosamine synthase-like glycosyltransferase